MKTLFTSILFMCYLMSLTSFAVATRPEESLVLYFPLDKGDKADDLSGKGNDGNVFGTKLVEGQINKGFQYSNGTADYIEIPGLKGLTKIKQFSVSAWVKISQVPTALTIVCGISDDQNYRWNFGVRVGEVFHTNTHKGGWGPELNINRKFINEWHHVAATYGEGGNARILYYDGEEAGRDSSYQGELTLTKIRVGRGQSNFDSWPFYGIIDEVAIFDRLLEEDEIQEVMKGIKMAVAPTLKLATTWGDLKSQF